MSSNKPKSLSELIATQHGSLNRLAAEATRRLELTDRLRNALNADTAAQIAGCNLRDDGTLVVLATSSEWAARLRFESDKLLTACREVHPGTTKVRIRVAQPVHTEDH